MVKSKDVEAVAPQYLTNMSEMNNKRPDPEERREFCERHKLDKEKFTAQAVETAIQSARADEDVLTHYVETCHLAA